MYSEVEIVRTYEKSLEDALRILGNLAVARGRRPSFQGLSGWIFEQTIRSCLEDEFSSQMAALSAAEQVSLKGRAKVDLLLGEAAIEIKAAGFFGDESEKYYRYRVVAEDTGLTYLCVRLHESYKPYSKRRYALLASATHFSCMSLVHGEISSVEWPKLMVLQCRRVG
jgi:hypothetical protein